MEWVNNFSLRQSIRLAVASRLPLAAEVGLFINDYQPIPTTLIADLTVATFTDYANIASVADAIEGTDPATLDELVIFPSVLVWTVGAAPTPQTVFGYFLLSETGILIGAGRLATPIDISAAGQIVELETLELRIGQNPTFGD